MKTIIISLIAIFCITSNTSAQTTFSGGADIVSAYIWRGSYNAGASIQPTLELKTHGFSVSAWGSTDFGGNGKKEVDLAVKYSWKGLTLGITDYWWAGEGAFKYFHYSKGVTSHLFEGSVAYQLPIKKFPLIISWNTFFAGADFKEDGKRGYSTYIELCYPFSVGTFDFKAIVGAAPWNSPAFLPSNNKGFSVCNVAIGAQRAIKCTDNFSIPLYTQLIFNPATEDIHCVFGLALKF